MKTLAGSSLAREPGGFALLELLVTALIATIVGLGVGSLYISTVRALDTGSMLAYVQRQGTQIQEELVHHAQRATALEVNNSISLCTTTTGAVAAGKAMAYRRLVGNTTAPTIPIDDELWCLYEQQRTGDAFPQLWRCQVCGAATSACTIASLTPPHTCAGTAENLVASALRGFQHLPIAVSGTTFICGPAGCGASVDIAFGLDVKRSASDPGDLLLGQPRQFGLNITVRN
jgi:hypothetical protein